MFQTILKQSTRMQLFYLRLEHKKSEINSPNCNGIKLPKKLIPPEKYIDNSDNPAEKSKKQVKSLAFLFS
jgi:hypothetical protein